MPSSYFVTHDKYSLIILKEYIFEIGRDESTRQNFIKMYLDLNVNFFKEKN